ncbi:MFS transporter [Pseudonocardia sp.]|uniref:MFS transporter n=1 Tax=Pseudonocardia sp. TaxID=60912 RepID=UPI003D0F02DC
MTTDTRTEGTGEPPPTSAGGGGARVGVITALVTFGGLVFGYDTGIISGALLFIQPEFDLTALAQGVVVSSLFAGAMVGAASSGYLTDRWGRRPMMGVGSVVFIASSLLGAVAGSATTLTASRVVLGLAVGVMCMTVPVYLSEIAPARRRGALGVLFQVAITAGIVLAYVVTTCSPARATGG